MPLLFQRCLLGLLALVSLAGGIACGSSDEPPLADGLWVAYPHSLWGGTGPIRLVHGDGDQEFTVGADAVYRSLTWSPDGDQIAVVVDAPEPALVILATHGAAEDRSVPLPSAETALYWSPNGVRIAAVSPEAITLVTPELDIVASFELPADLDASGEVGEGLWSAAGDYFAVPFNGYVVVVLPAARWVLIDPAQFVRHPGQTGALTVVDWTEEGIVAVFEESLTASPTRYVLDVTEDPPVLTASTDYPKGTGPLDGLISEALEASGGRDVYVGRRGQPIAARWAVAEPSATGGSPDLFVRVGDRFLAILAGRFAGASAVAMAADIGLVVLPESPER